MHNCTITDRSTDVRLSVVTALSIEYFKENLSMSAYPPDPKRHFMLSHLTPFGTRLETEVIGCASANPEAKPKASTIYTLGQNGYNPSDAAHKFIRMRWSVLITGLMPRAKLC